MKQTKIPKMVALIGAGAGRLATQERVAVGADRRKPWLEKFPDFLVS
jgi:hypothetical protein